MTTIAMPDELADIAGKVASLKAQIENVTRRQINHQGDDRENRRELGSLSGECLALRLSFLYKIEEHWPEVLNALRAQASSESTSKLSQNDKRWRLLEHGCESVSWTPVGGEPVSFNPRDVPGLVAMRKKADETLEAHLQAMHAEVAKVEAEQAEEAANRG